MATHAVNSQFIVKDANTDAQSCLSSGGHPVLHCDDLSVCSILTRGPPLLSYLIISNVPDKGYFS